MRNAARLRANKKDEPEVRRKRKEDYDVRVRSWLLNEFIGIISVP